MGKNWLFVKEGLKKISRNGALLPSSKFLAEQMIRPIRMRKNIRIAELGAGTGSVTRLLAKKLPLNGKLFVFEINAHFAELLRQEFTGDDRIIISESNAIHFGQALKDMGCQTVDYVISGLPLSNFNRRSRELVLAGIEGILPPEGKYIQFQYFLANWLEIRKHFRSRIVGYEMRNFPPAFLYVCEKK